MPGKTPGSAGLFPDFSGFLGGVALAVWRESSRSTKIIVFSLCHVIVAG